MSRLGKKPISLPDKVEVKSAQDGLVEIKGPKGSLSVKLPFGITFKVIENEVQLEKTDEIENSDFGLYRSLLNNSIIGVSKGFAVRLKLIGVGYRAAVQGSKLDVQVGYSHPTLLDIPQGIQVKVEGGTIIIVEGIDKQLVGQFSANIRSTRPPEPYKGKGIRYEDEFVRKKEGKAAKGKA